MKLSLASEVACLISFAVAAGVRAKLHKGDIQDLVSAVVGRRDMTVAECAFAQRCLDASGYAAPTGFYRNASGDGGAAYRAARATLP
jgi:hypothetical protein